MTTGHIVPRQGECEAFCVAQRAALALNPIDRPSMLLQAAIDGAQVLRGAVFVDDLGQPVDLTENLLPAGF